MLISKVCALYLLNVRNHYQLKLKYIIFTNQYLEFDANDKQTLKVQGPITQGNFLKVIYLLKLKIMIYTNIL